MLVFRYINFATFELHLILFDLEASVVVDNSWLLNIIVLSLA